MQRLLFLTFLEVDFSTVLVQFTVQREEIDAFGAITDCLIYLQLKITRKERRNREKVGLRTA